MPRLVPRVPRPSRRARRLALAVSRIGALVVTAGMVGQSAYAAFTESTATYTLTWSTGTVAIADDDAGAVLFSASGPRAGARQPAASPSRRPAARGPASSTGTSP